MTAEAHHHYDDLHQLVDRLGPDQADAMRAVALQLVKVSPDPAGDDIPRSGQWPPSWFGSVSILSDNTNVAEQSREILRAEYGRS